MRKLIDSFRRSFSARLSLWVVSFAALVFLAAMSYFFFVSRRYVREEAILRATQVVENSVLRLNSILEDVEISADNLEWLVYRHLDEPRPEIDRWITSKLNTLIREVKAAYEDYDVKTAGRLIETFVCDHVSNWYVRLNRSRFWNGDKDAFQTLYDVLMDVAVLAAPIAPFFMDQLYLDLGGQSESVHYVLMPEADASVIDPELEERMALAQQATSMASSATFVRSFATRTTSRLITMRIRAKETMFRVVSEIFK